MLYNLELELEQKWIDEVRWLIMKEFISILISFLFMSIADSVDSAFNNYISLDAIAVCGSLIFIKFIFKSIGEIGIYTYRIIRKNASSYLLILYI